MRRPKLRPVPVLLSALFLVMNAPAQPQDRPANAEGQVVDGQPDASRPPPGDNRIDRWMPREDRPPAAGPTGQEAGDLALAIHRQVQPCAERQPSPGPGAERIVTTLHVRVRPNGELAAAPHVLRQTGIDAENERYARRVADLVVRSFVECSPLRGLPAALYGVPGGWSNFTMNYRLPG